MEFEQLEKILILFTSKDFIKFTVSHMRISSSDIFFLKLKALTIFSYFLFAYNVKIIQKKVCHDAI